MTPQQRADAEQADLLRAARDFIATAGKDVQQSGPWPAWARYTATATMSAGTVLVIMTLAFADVRTNAATGAALAPRVRALEDGMAWLRGAIRTGRDPDTGALLPWAK